MKNILVPYFHLLLLTILFFHLRNLTREHSPSQAQSDVQSRPAFVHLHFFTLSFLHLQETSSLPILDALGSVVHKSSYMLLILTQLQSLGDGSVRAGARAWPHTCPPWYTARRKCCSRATFLGGIRWTLLFLQTVATCLVNIGLSAWSALKQYNDPLNGMHSVFINTIWCSRGKSESLGQLKPRLLMLSSFYVQQCQQDIKNSYFMCIAVIVKVARYYALLHIYKTTTTTRINLVTRSSLKSNAEKNFFKG